MFATSVISERSVVDVRRRLLVVCNDVIGTQMAGSAIRCIEIARALFHDFDVTVTAPRVEGGLDLPFPVLETDQRHHRQLADCADVILVQGNALIRHPFLKRARAALIADLYCPLPLEYHQSSQGVEIGTRMAAGSYAARVMAEQLAYCDYFLCASEKQLDFWAGALAMAGRINGLRWPEASHASLDELLAVIPFGLPDEPPVPTAPQLRRQFGIPADAFVALWGGGLYQWFDPLTIIKAVGELAGTDRPVHLVFIGIKHPNPEIHQHSIVREAIDLAERLGLKDRFVHFNFGWVPFSERQSFFLDANVGVSAHFDNPETRFSFRTRMLDYLWCGLPIVTSAGDNFADIVEHRQLGAVVACEDVDGWIKALRNLSNDRTLADACSRRVAETAANYRWQVVTEPLRAVVQTLAPASDRDFARSYFHSRRVRPSLLRRVRYIYETGGLRSVGNTFRRRIRRFFC
ncbi:glycosyltransferase [Roseibium sediminis]|uniref:glycosyltransferase n=1 Tax=Roseibium sediminis TaxID=1775174 RepID=UPI00123D37F7|nr:glycosyltransferase [Roseibium sediminis]